MNEIKCPNCGKVKGHGDRHLTRFRFNGPVPTTFEPTRGDKGQVPVTL